MGLHRDPSNYSSNPIEIQIRRLIWYQICFLDLRTCEATGPRPQIRRDEYDTRFPLNIDDEELELATQRGDSVAQDSKSFTDMTITRMRAECFEMYRLIWVERPRLQRRVEPGEKRTTLTGLLSRIQSFRAAMEQTYLPMMTKTNPLHVVAMEMYGILSARLYTATLHPFASSDRRKMPERLRQIMMSACIMIIEHSMNIEQQPALSQWTWYVGALHQYHGAMLLLSEMYVTQADPSLSTRIWRCLDYTFDLPASLSESEKVRFLLGELSERTRSYALRRRLRAPGDMPHVGNYRLRPSVPRSQVQVESQEGSLDRQSSSPSSTGYDTSNHQYNQYQNLPDNRQHSYNPPMVSTRGPLGAVPQVDWGTVDIDTHLMDDTEPYNFGGFAPPKPTSSSTSPTRSGPNLGMDGTSSASNPVQGVSTRLGLKESPTDALINDIDWVCHLLHLNSCTLYYRLMRRQNEWDQLFGDAQVGAGNMLIPPFTFPSLDPNNTLWQTSGAM